MLTQKQEEMWDAIIAAHPTAEDVLIFFVKYSGYQILDDKMYEYLKRNEYITEEE